MLGGILGVVQWAGDRLAQWSERRDALAKARLDLQLADLTARAELAAFRVKSEMEWDLTWATSATNSWRAEYILILWSIPTIGLFVPWLRPTIMEGFDYLREFHPDAPAVFMAGWAAIFAATFGMRQLMNIMLPGKVGKLAGVIGQIPDDVPDKAVEAAQRATNLARGGVGQQATQSPSLPRLPPSTVSRE